VLLSAFTGGAVVVYVLPDSKAVAEVFSLFAATLKGRDGEPVLPDQ
jgi:hypothetical protein